MQITYDPSYNIAYIKLRDESAQVETIKISDELSIDLSPDGKIYGIELLNANEILLPSKDSLVTFVNERSKKHLDVRLPD